MATDTHTEDASSALPEIPWIISVDDQVIEPPRVVDPDGEPATPVPAATGGTAVAELAGAQAS